MDQVDIVRDYKVLRGAAVALSNRLVETLSRDEIGAAAAALGMRRGKTIELETEDEIGVMMDYAIYNLFRDGRNAVDRMLEENPPPERSIELRLLRSMQKSHFTIFEVQKPIPGFGVRGLDGPEKTPILLVDMGFSVTAVPGLALATRIHSPGDGWWITTGAALPLNKEALDRIIRDTQEYTRRFGQEPPEKKRTTMIVRACIASGASRQISYGNVGKGNAAHADAPTRRRSIKVGRNDPCPCDSGKKYKRCCGGGWSDRRR
jgi:hypothetical protein